MTADIRAVVSGAGSRPAATIVLSDSHDTGRRDDGTDARLTVASPSVRALETEELSPRATKVTA